MNYYDPRTESSFFRTIAQSYQTKQQQKEEEELEKKENRESMIRIGLTPIQILENQRQNTLMETAIKQGIRDPNSPTGFKYEEIPDSAFTKDRRKYDPRKVTDFFKERYRSTDKRIQEVSPFRPASTTESVEEAKRFTQFNDPVRRLGGQTGAGTLGFENFQMKQPGSPYDQFKPSTDHPIPFLRPRTFVPNQQFETTPGLKKSQETFKPLVNTKGGNNLDNTGNLNDLIKQRNASTGDIRKGFQNQINELYKSGGGTFEGADEALKARSATDTAMKGLGTVGSAVGAVGTAKNLYDIASSDATGGKKLKALGETGLDYASSAMIGSGNPYGVAGGLAIKGGKALWDILT